MASHMPGPPHAGCWRMRARAIRGNANSVGGGKPGATPARRAGDSFHKDPHKTALIAETCALGTLHAKMWGGITAFLQSKIYSRVLLRDRKQADGTFFRIMSGPPTLRRNPISAFSVGRHAPRRGGLHHTRVP